MKYIAIKERISNLIDKKEIVKAIDFASKYDGILEEVPRKYLKQYVNQINNDKSSLKQLQTGMKILELFIKLKMSKKYLESKKKISDKIKKRGKKGRIKGSYYDDFFEVCRL